MVLAVGYPGLVLRSDDRGSTWQRITVPTGEALFAVALLADGRGIMVGRSGLVLTSSDAGRSWQKRDSGCREHLFDVVFLPDDQAWAVGAFGTILHSADGGRSWQPQQYDATPPPAEQGGVISYAERENEGAADEARLNAVTFADGQQGWVVGEFGIILHTADGGRTWRRQPGASGNLLFDVLVLDGQRVLAAGAEGTLQESSDAGASWRLLPAGSKLHFYGLAVRGRQLFITSQEGKLFVRRPGESRLQAVDLGAPTWLNAVTFLDERLGFIVGGRGHLLYSSDGGKNWQKITGR